MFLTSYLEGQDFSFMEKSSTCLEQAKRECVLMVEGLLFFSVGVCDPSIQFLYQKINKLNRFREQNRINPFGSMFRFFN